MPYLPWNNDLIELLMYCVKVKGGHLCRGKKVSETWTEINDMFFDQGETIALKPQHYKHGHYRKLRDKYNSSLAKIQNDIESGIQSDKEGDLSPLYVLVRQITEEIAEKKAKKGAKTESREKAHETEREVLASSGPLKRKLIDGEIVEKSRRIANSHGSTGSLDNNQRNLGFNERMLGFNERLLEILEPKTNKNENCFAREEEFEMGFMEWIKSQKKTVQDLIDCAELSERYQEYIIDIGIKTLVSIYCTSGANFSPLTFKQELRDMEFPMIVCSKTYMALQTWRREYEAVAKLPQGHRLEVEEENTPE